MAAADSTAADGRAALVLARAAIRSVDTCQPVRVNDVTP
jgi:hypothetical protein